MLTAASTQPSHWKKFQRNSTISTTVASATTISTTANTCQTKKSTLPLHSARKVCNVSRNFTLFNAF